MRAISPHPRYSLQLIEAPVKRGADRDGHIVEYQDTKPIIADFRQVGLHEWEQIAALQHFSFSGLPEGVNPLSTVSSWDSEAHALANNWDEATLEKVDARLLLLAAQSPSSVLVVPKPTSPAPWPTYDVQDATEILDTLQITQLDPQSCRKYEVEHQNRPQIVDLFERLLAGETLDDLIEELSPTPEPETKAAPIVEGVASDQSAAPAKVDPLAKARAVRATNLAAKKAALVGEAPPELIVNA